MTNSVVWPLPVPAPPYSETTTHLTALGQLFRNVHSMPYTALLAERLYPALCDITLPYGCSHLPYTKAQASTRLTANINLSPDPYRIMQKNLLQTNALLLLVAMIWGSAFVAQRLGMDSIGPLLFSGLRFILGALVVLPFLLYRRYSNRVSGPFLDRQLLAGGTLLGVIVTIGINLQQTGLLHTSVSNAGFITGMYVLIVPLLGLLIGLRATIGIWLGALLALAGLYLLSVGDGFQVAHGDVLQLGGAFCWAVHVLVMGYLAKRYDPLRLTFIQFITCAALSLAAALWLEPVSLPHILAAAPALLYAGLLSIGVGFSLQAIALRRAKPAHAAIILSLEGVFAALAAALFLGESLSLQGYLGAALMLCAMLLAQLWPQRQPPAPVEEPLTCLSTGPSALPVGDIQPELAMGAATAPVPAVQSADASRPDNAG